MKYVLYKINICLIILFSCGFSSIHTLYKKNPKGLTLKEVTFSEAMRKLWSDHIFWTRMYILTAVDDLSGMQETTTRLLKNQEDIGNAIAPYYGTSAGKGLTNLLKQHILISADVIKAAKSNNKQELEKTDAQWHENAKEIAVFLSKANPHWSYQDLLDMLNLHLKLTTEEVMARIHKNWNKDISSFDKVFNQALSMADVLSKGIIKQFPSKF